MYIILTKEQCETLAILKEKYREFLTERHVDIEPIPLEDGTFILPEKVLSDQSLKELFIDIEVKAEVEKMEVRVMQKEEIIYKVVPEESISSAEILESEIQPLQLKK